MESRIPVFSFLPFPSMHLYPDLSVQIHIALFFTKQTVPLFISIECAILMIRHHKITQIFRRKFMKRLELCHVSFSYTEEPLIEDLSLTIEEQEAGV